MRMLVVDVEASGTDPRKHSIVSVGALDLSNPTNRFYEECRIWEGAHVMDEALTVNGFSLSQITDESKQTEADLVHAFLNWSEGLTERTLAGQNVSFDRDKWQVYVLAMRLTSACEFDILKTHSHVPSNYYDTR